MGRTLLPVSKKSFSSSFPSLTLRSLLILLRLDFTAPICDLFVEIFELKENNWLRRQAIVIILQVIIYPLLESCFLDQVSDWFWFW